MLEAQNNLERYNALMGMIHMACIEKCKDEESSSLQGALATAALVAIIAQLDEDAFVREMSARISNELQALVAFHDKSKKD